MTEVELEMLTDPDMHLFVHGERDSRRRDDSDRPTTHILYVDCNNFYGTVMSEFLPVSDFRWLDQDRIDALDITTIDAESMTGHILEVDLEYPTELHDLHNDYPLAPDRLRITKQMLSPYSR